MTQAGIKPEVVPVVRAAIEDRIEALEGSLAAYIARDNNDRMSDNFYHTSGAAGLARERIRKTKAKIANLMEALEALWELGDGRQQ